MELFMHHKFDITENIRLIWR